MPSVPQYNSNVQSQAFQSPKFSLDLPGGNQVQQANDAAFKASEGLTNEISKLALEEKKKADEMAVTEAGGKLSAIETDLLYHPETGALNTKGKNAFGILDTVSENYKKQTDEIYNGLTNDAQKESFQRMVISHGGDINKAVQIHTSGEIRKYDTDTTDAYLSNERNAGVQSLDPSRIQLSIDRQKAAIADYGNRNGLPSELLTEKQAEVASKTHSEVITRMVDNKAYLPARAYFDSVKDQIRGDQLGPIEKLVKEGSALGIAQQNTDNYFKKGLSQTDALKEAYLVKDPDARKATVTEVEQRFAQLEKARDGLIKQREQELTNQIIQNKGQRPQLSSLQGLPEDKVKGLIGLSDTLLKQPEVPSGGADYQKWLAISESKDAQPTYLSTNLAVELTGKVSQTELEGLLKDQAKKRASDTNSTDYIDYLDNNEKVKRDVLTQSGILRGGADWYNPISWFLKSGKPLNQEKFFQINNDINLARRQKETALGRNLDSTEMKAVVNGVVTGQILSNKASPTITVDDIPTNTRGQIEGLYQKNGLRISNEKLIQSYIDGQKKGFWK